MSAGDALVGLAQIALVKGIIGDSAFKKWDWNALGIMLAFGIGQNFVITYLMRAKLNVGILSWAPLLPFQGPGIIQNQESWLMQPFLFYALLIQYRRGILGIYDESEDKHTKK